MPTWEIADDNGNLLVLEGDSEPTEQELEELFTSRQSAPSRQIEMPSGFSLTPERLAEYERNFPQSQPVSPFGDVAGQPDTGFTQALFQQMPHDVNANVVEPAMTFAGKVGATIGNVATGAIAPFRMALGQSPTSAFSEPVAEQGKPVISGIEPPTDARGIVPSLRRGLAGFLTPEMLLTAPLALESKALQAGFFGSAVASIPQVLEAVSEAKTPAEVRGALTDLTLTGGMATLIGRGLGRETPITKGTQNETQSQVQLQTQQPQTSRPGEVQEPVGAGVKKPSESRAEITPAQEQAIAARGGMESLEYKPDDLTRYNELKAEQGTLQSEGKIVSSETGEFTPEWSKNWTEFEALRNKYNGMPPQQVSAAPTPKAVREIANELEPAVMVNGKMHSGNKGHNALVREAAAKDGLDPNETILEFGVLAENPNTGFNYRGKFISRQEAAKMLGEKEMLTPEAREALGLGEGEGQGLNSERLFEIRKKLEASEPASVNAQPKETAPPGEPASISRGTSPVAAPEAAMAGPGSTVPSDIGVSVSELTQLAKTAPKVPGRATSEIGESAKELIKGATESVKGFATKVKDFLVSNPKWDSYDKALGEWGLLRQESSRDAYMAWKDFKKQIPNTERRGAIAAFVDAGGDMAMLEKGATELPSKYGKIYEQAAKLTPEEITFAKNIRGYFDKRLQDAMDSGILENGIENYIRRIYEKDSDWKSAKIAELQRLSTATPDFAKQRFYETDADAIKAGQKPIMDFAGRVLEYDQALNHAIADRAFVKSMMKLKMPDGRPRIDVAGSGKLLPEGEVPKEAVLIKPQGKLNSDEPIDNRSDYRPFNHPAFRKYKWVTKDSAGKDVFVQGDVIVHPDALPQMQKLLETSKIRAHPVGRAALNVSSTIKQTMLDLSLFHPVQIGIHGMEHRIAPTRLTEIDLKNPVQRGLVEHGLIVAEDRGFNDWSEGLHGTSLTRHIPKIGPKLQDFHNWMFKEWIPTIKMNMATHALERNRKRYPELNEDQLLKLTAEQGNAAFGGLNYRQLGRSQTMQDFLRLTFLAPDFLEARGRFAGQAMKGFGREQLEALMLGAATLYITARIFNQISTGNPHWEKENAFSVIAGDHAYGLRTVQGDLLHLISKPGQFWYHRLNPVTTRPLMEIISGRDYFGRQAGIGDVLLDELKTIVPISLRGAVEGKEQSILESGLNAMGITTRRYNAITQAYDLAKQWREKTQTRPEPGEFIYDPDKDPLRNLKLALQHEHTPDAVKEIAQLVSSGNYTTKQLNEHFERYARALIAGSKKNQREFMESLRPDQQEIVKLAQERKKKVLADFRAALRLYRQQPALDTPQ